MTAGHARAPWWATRRAMALIVAAMIVPFLAAPIIPLFDLPGHMGRYAIEAGADPLLRRAWHVRWTAIGNLGVDLLVVPLSWAIGVEWATRIVVGAIPALTAAGFLLAARARHGTLPPILPSQGIPFSI